MSGPSRGRNAARGKPDKGRNGSGARERSIEREVPSTPANKPNERLTWIYMLLIGHNVEVHVKDGSVFEGILHTVQDNITDYSILLQYVKTVKDKTKPDGADSLKALAQQTVKRQIFCGVDIVQIVGKKVDMLAEAVSGQAKNKSTFRTDAELGRGKGGLFGRELQPWVPDEADGVFALEDFTTTSSSTSWNQFEENEKLFGVRTSWNEDLYTTSLDKVAGTSKYSEADAAKLAAEIQGQVTSNLHQAEERGQILQTEDDEELRFSAVIRDTEPDLHNHTKQANGQVKAAEAKPTVSGPAGSANPNAHGGAWGQPLGKGGRSTPMDIETYRQARMLVTQPQRPSGSYGTPPNSHLSKSPQHLLSDPSGLKALNLDPAVPKIDKPIQNSFAEFKKRSEEQKRHQQVLDLKSNAPGQPQTSATTSRNTAGVRPAPMGGIAATLQAPAAAANGPAVAPEARLAAAKGNQAELASADKPSSSSSTGAAVGVPHPPAAAADKPAAVPNSQTAAAPKAVASPQKAAPAAENAAGSSKSAATPPSAAPATSAQPAASSTKLSSFKFNIGAKEFVPTAVSQPKKPAATAPASAASTSTAAPAVATTSSQPTQAVAAAAPQPAEPPAAVPATTATTAAQPSAVAPAVQPVQTHAAPAASAPETRTQQTPSPKRASAAPAAPAQPATTAAVQPSHAVPVVAPAAAVAPHVPAAVPAIITGSMPMMMGAAPNVHYTPTRHAVQPHTAARLHHTAPGSSQTSKSSTPTAGPNRPPPPPVEAKRSTPQHSSAGHTPPHSGDGPHRHDRHPGSTPDRFNGRRDVHALAAMQHHPHFGSTHMPITCAGMLTSGFINLAQPITSATHMLNPAQPAAMSMSMQFPDMAQQGFAHAGSQAALMHAQPGMLHAGQLQPGRPGFSAAPMAMASFPQGYSFMPPAAANPNLMPHPVQQQMQQYAMAHYAMYHGMPFSAPQQYIMTAAPMSNAVARPNVLPQANFQPQKPTADA